MAISIGCAVTVGAVRVGWVVYAPNPPAIQLVTKHALGKMSDDDIIVQVIGNIDGQHNGTIGVVKMV